MTERLENQILSALESTDDFVPKALFASLWAEYREVAAAAERDECEGCADAATVVRHANRIRDLEAERAQLQARIVDLTKGDGRHVCDEDADAYWRLRNLMGIPVAMSADEAEDALRARGWTSPDSRPVPPYPTPAQVEAQVTEPAMFCDLPATRGFVVEYVAAAMRGDHTATARLLMTGEVR